MKRILVVDDEPTLVATLKYNLGRERFQVMTAGDGESAVSLARGLKSGFRERIHENPASLPGRRGKGTSREKKNKD